ncbi:unnamed protein product, partial [Rotaria sp. Silwood1]
PDDPADFQYSLWFTVDINVQAPDAQTTVDLTAPCLVCLIKYDVYLGTNDIRRQYFRTKFFFSMKHFICLLIEIK